MPFSQITRIAMLKNRLFSASAVVAASLTLCACGGGGSDGGTAGDVPAKDLPTVPFLWASLSQVIPAGQTSLTITPASCEDWSTSAHAAMTGVTIEISANGDVVLKKDGVEKIRVAFSSRSIANLDIVGTPGSVDAYVKASGRSSDVTLSRAQSVQPQVNSTGRATYGLTQTTFGMDSVRAGMNVQCTLSAPLKHNGGLTMDNLRAGFVPTGKDMGTLMANGANSTTLVYTPAVFRSGFNVKGVFAPTDMPLTDSRVQRLSQNFATSSAFLGGMTFTHCLTLKLLSNVGTGGSVQDEFTIGYDATEGDLSALKMTGYQTNNT